MPFVFLNSYMCWCRPRTMPPVPPATRIGSVSSLSNVISPENVVNSGVLNVPSGMKESYVVFDLMNLLLCCSSIRIDEFIT